MNEITIRIREVFKSSGKTQSDLARDLNVTPAYIWKLLNKDDAAPSDRFVEDICRKMDVNETWLRSGTGEMFRQLSRTEEIAKLSTSLFKGEKNSFKERFILALSKLNEEEWELLEGIAEKIANEKD